MDARLAFRRLEVGKVDNLLPVRTFAKKEGDE